MTLSIKRANLDVAKRAELNSAKKSEKDKVTESMVESAILQDKDYQEAQDRLINIGRQHGILKAMVKALEQRKDMLIQLGSTNRQELSLREFGIDIKKVRERNQ
jgi:hypothetical protein